MYPPPPSYPGYPPPPMPLRPVRGVAIFAVVALVCDSLIGVVAAVIDLWYASSRVPSPPRGLFNAWWAAWLIGIWMTNLGSRLLFNADELESLAAAARFDVVSVGLMLIAAVLAIGVIRKITEAQEEHRSAAVIGMPLGAPGGMAPGAPGGGYPGY
ncbi:DUF4328 domain-containing protein [Nonomuraea sp. NPDC049158]|uniref:DUF4328 domain-containing protein n=1 Tax=Nonomuraea sp. NPDC049158 TaxID=3155649 RepID=UPI003403B46D